MASEPLRRRKILKIIKKHALKVRKIIFSAQGGGEGFQNKIFTPVLHSNNSARMILTCKT